MPANASAAGTAIFIGVAQFCVAMILVGAYYPCSASSTDSVNDLGSVCNTSGAVQQPPMIFDYSFILLGALVLVGSIFLQRAFRVRAFSSMVAVAGLGALGMGFSPQISGTWTETFPILVFLFTGLAAVVAFRIAGAPISYVSGILGVLTLAALVLYVGGTNVGLGAADMERLIVYPATLWAIVFSGYLVSTPDWPKSKPSGN